MTRLQKFREEKGLSREALAAEAGVSFAYIYRLEMPPDQLGSRSNPSVQVAQRIALVLGVSVADIWPPNGLAARETRQSDAAQAL